MEKFEPVLLIEDYFDGPRAGTALFRGRPYRFRSRMIDVYSPDDDEPDVFELTPSDDPSRLSFLAHAKFEVAPDARPAPAGEFRKLVVQWEVLPEVGSSR